MGLRSEDVEGVLDMVAVVVVVESFDVVTSPFAGAIAPDRPEPDNDTWLDNVEEDSSEEDDVSSFRVKGETEAADPSSDTRPPGCCC